MGLLGGGGDGLPVPMSEEGLDGRKPGWGEAQKDYEDLGPDAARLMSDERGVPLGEEKRAARGI